MVRDQIGLGKSEDDSLSELSRQSSNDKDSHKDEPQQQDEQYKVYYYDPKVSFCQIPRGTNFPLANWN